MRYAFVGINHVLHIVIPECVSLFFSFLVFGHFRPLLYLACEKKKDQFAIQGTQNDKRMRKHCGEHSASQTFIPKSLSVGQHAGPHIFSLSFLEARDRQNDWRAGLGWSSGLDQHRRVLGEEGRKIISSQSTPLYPGEK